MQRQSASRRGNSAQWRQDESGELRYEWVGAMMMVESASESTEPVLRVSDVDRGPCWVVVVTQSLRHPHSSLHSPRRLYWANHIRVVEEMIHILRQEGFSYTVREGYVQIMNCKTLMHGYLTPIVDRSQMKNSSLDEDHNWWRSKLRIFLAGEEHINRQIVIFRRQKYGIDLDFLSVCKHEQQTHYVRSVKTSPFMSSL